jgi:hypothetical protein
MTGHRRHLASIGDCRTKKYAVPAIAGSGFCDDNGAQ